MSKVIKRIGSEWLLVSPANNWSINASCITSIEYNEVFLQVPLIEISTTKGQIFIGKAESFPNELKTTDTIFVDDDLYEYLYATLFLE
jgi:predicted extracellular nuclease